MEQLRNTAHRRKLSLKDMLSMTLRRGLQAPVDAGERPPYRCPEFAMGSPVAPFDVDKALAAAAACEDGETALKLELRK